MSNEEQTFSREEGEGALEAQQAQAQAQAEARFGAALEQAETELELGRAPPGQGWWNIWAFGPWQVPWRWPSRIIMVGEAALLHTVVWMDPFIMGPNIVGHGDKIEIKYVTSDMEDMVKADPSLQHHFCIDTYDTKPIIHPSGYYFHHWWLFRPDRPACIYETNICARICNCRNEMVREYAAWVRYVWDYDPELIRPLLRPWEFHPRGWSFNDPIRFAVFAGGECNCPTD
jgi:hypothetical protein